MLKLREILPPNRVAAITAFLTALGAALASFAGAWGDEQVVGAVGGATGLIGAVLVAVKYLDGAQKWESYIADPHKDVATDGTPGNTFAATDDPFAAPDDDDEDTQS